MNAAPSDGACISWDIYRDLKMLTHIRAEHSVFPAQLGSPVVDLRHTEGIQLLGSSFLFKYNCTEKCMGAFKLNVLFLLSNEDGIMGNVVFCSFSLLVAQATVEVALC